MLLAILAGFLQLISTVVKENNAANINITGLNDTSLGIAVAEAPSKNIPKTTGTTPNETIAPNANPIGIPIIESFKACPFTILLICFGDAPKVFNLP